MMFTVTGAYTSGNEEMKLKGQFVNVCLSPKRDLVKRCSCPRSCPSMHMEFLPPVIPTYPIVLEMTAGG